MPTAVPQYKNYTGLVYTADSGVFNFNERIFYTEKLQGNNLDAQLYAQSHQRGALWTLPSLVGVFCVEESSTEKARGNIGTVTVKYAWLGSAPPDKWNVTPYEINPPVERNIFFSALTIDDLKKAKASFTAAQAQGQTSIDTAITGTVNAVLTKNLINKWLKGEETFYMAGLKYQWTTYATSLASYIFREGGYIETPGGPGIFPAGFTWIRQCDEDDWNNGLYSYTRTWIGGPTAIGGWDTDIYGIPAQ